MSSNDFATSNASFSSKFELYIMEFVKTDTSFSGDSLPM